MLLWMYIQSNTGSSNNVIMVVQSGQGYQNLGFDYSNALVFEQYA